MYIIKEEYKNKSSDKRFNKLLKKYNKQQKDIAEEIEGNVAYISLISSGRAISKVYAYAICKAINEDLEIHDLFTTK